MNRVANFTLGEEEVLGFDTGLGAQAFAQAKMAQFITQQGCLVYPDGTIKPWKASGVVESDAGSMIIHGPAFPGESLIALLGDTNRREEALDAVRSWIKARLIMEKEALSLQCFPGAAGAFVTLSHSKDFPAGTILFAPERIVKRCLEATGEDEVKAAQRWIHPDLNGQESETFSAASMLYAVFCGEPPFAVREEAEAPQKKKETDGRSVLETLRQDIREGVFMPPELAAPGLDKELCKLLNETLGVKKQQAEIKKNPGLTVPSLEALSACMNRSGSEKINSWFSPLGEEENSRLLHDREQYQKSTQLQVKTRRFVLRNTTLIAVCAVAFIALILGIRGYIKNQAERPNTRGMTPIEVVETYYGAFGPMDHLLMEACVLGKAGGDDINMVVNLYVITRMRGAYESNTFTNATAQEWLDAGMPETPLSIFGITGIDGEQLKIISLGGSENEGEVYFELEYLLWVPANMMGGDDELPESLEELYEAPPSTPPPVALRYRDRLKLVLYKDAWRISEIVRTVI